MRFCWLPAPRAPRPVGAVVVGVEAGVYSGSAFPAPGPWNELPSSFLLRSRSGPLHGREWCVYVTVGWGWGKVYFPRAPLLPRAVTDVHFHLGTSRRFLPAGTQGSTASPRAPQARAVWHPLRGLFPLAAIAVASCPLSALLFVSPWAGPQRRAGRRRRRQGADRSAVARGPLGARAPATRLAASRRRTGTAAGGRRWRPTTAGTGSRGTHEAGPPSRWLDTEHVGSKWRGSPLVVDPAAGEEGRDDYRGRHPPRQAAAWWDPKKSIRYHATLQAGRAHAGDAGT